MWLGDSTCITGLIIFRIAAGRVSSMLLDFKVFARARLYPILARAELCSKDLRARTLLGCATLTRWARNLQFNLRYEFTRPTHKVTRISSQDSCLFRNPSNWSPLIYGSNIPQLESDRAFYHRQSLTNWLLSFCGGFLYRSWILRSVNCLQTVFFSCVDESSGELIKWRMRYPRTSWHVQ